MEYRLSELIIYEAGQMKGPQQEPQQEDCIYPSPGTATEESRVFIVCDGMGGPGAGDVASSEVCSALGMLIDNPDKPFDNDYLTKAIVKAYNALDNADHGQASLMGTTLAMLRLAEEGALVAHIGNSRVYHLRPGDTEADTKIIYCTEDHTLANKERHEGTVVNTAANPNVDKNKVLTRAMLSHAKRRCAPHVHTSSDIRPGDYFLLCTDGLLENLSDTDIRAIFSKRGGSDHDKRLLLMQACVDNKDNYSAIIVHITDVMQENSSASQPAPSEKAPISEPRPKRMPPAESMSTAESAIPTTSEPRPAAHSSSATASVVMPAMANPRDSQTQSHDYRSKHDTENRHTSKPQKSQKQPRQKRKLSLEFSAKTLLYIIAGLAVIMLAYSLFIRTDEVLQPAGMADDKSAPVPTADEDSYGYEITEQDIRNEAHQIAPEPVPEAEIEQDIEPETEEEPTEQPQEPSQPETQPEPSEPMLQE